MVKNNSNKTNGVVAKLTSYDPNKRENPHYKVEAMSSEKNKGLMMIQYLKGLFGVNEKDEEKHIQNEMNEQKKIKWTRDERGNIISPWSKKLKK